MGLHESTEFVARRYDRLAPIFPLMELAFAMPPSLRRRAVNALQLRTGARVLEIGCGSGRNLPLLASAVGTRGSVLGSDISRGMLRRAEATIARRGLSNVALVLQDASRLEVDTPFEAILFSLAYSVMPNREQALALAWDALRPGGRLVILDSGSFGRLGRLLDRASRRLSHATVLGDPAIRPWEEVAAHAPDVRTQFFQGGTYVICHAAKPGCDKR